MVRRQSRLLTTYDVLADAMLGMSAFALAYALRFESGLIAHYEGTAPLLAYATLLPFVAAARPARVSDAGLIASGAVARVDDFFAVFVGTIVAVVVGSPVRSTCRPTSPRTPRGTGGVPVSEYVWALFLVLIVMLAYGSRAIVRGALERRCPAGMDVNRVLLGGRRSWLARGRQILEHAELGYRHWAIVTPAPPAIASATAVFPFWGRSRRPAKSRDREQVDHLYVALPLEEHARMLIVITQIGQDGMIDIHVVPDVLQFLALRALEDLGGDPIISIKTCRCRADSARAGYRHRDFGRRVARPDAALAVIALLVRLTSPGPVLYRQERMGLDGKGFGVLQVPLHARRTPKTDTGPVWARDDDPRCTPLGGTCAGSGPRRAPAVLQRAHGRHVHRRPAAGAAFFIGKFRQRIPHYMLRHAMKAGITGWAQVNGWRGNTSLENASSTTSITSRTGRSAST